MSRHLTSIDAVSAILRLDHSTLQAAFEEGDHALRMADGRRPTSAELDLILQAGEEGWMAAVNFKRSELEFREATTAKLERGAELLRKREATELTDQESTELDDLIELLDAAIAFGEVAQ